MVFYWRMLIEPFVDARDGLYDLIRTPFDLQRKIVDVPKGGVPCAYNNGRHLLVQRLKIKISDDADYRHVNIPFTIQDLHHRSYRFGKSQCSYGGLIQ